MKSHRWLNITSPSTPKSPMPTSATNQSEILVGRVPARREHIQAVYADLFRMHTQVRKQGEIVELVLGLGAARLAQPGQRARPDPSVGTSSSPMSTFILIPPPG